MFERDATRGGKFEQARRECLDKGRWSLFCYGHPLEDIPGESEASELRIGKSLLEAS